MFKTLLNKFKSEKKKNNKNINIDSAIIESDNLTYKQIFYNQKDTKMQVAYFKENVFGYRIKFYAIGDMKNDGKIKTFEDYSVDYAIILRSIMQNYENKTVICIVHEGDIIYNGHKLVVTLRGETKTFYRIDIAQHLATGLYSLGIPCINMGTTMRDGLMTNDQARQQCEQTLSIWKQVVWEKKIRIIYEQSKQMSNSVSILCDQINNINEQYISVLKQHVTGTFESKVIHDTLSTYERLLIINNFTHDVLNNYNNTNASNFCYFGNRLNIMDGDSEGMPRSNFTPCWITENGGLLLQSTSLDPPKALTLLVSGRMLTFHVDSECKHVENRELRDVEGHLELTGKWYELKGCNILLDGEK